MHGLEELRERAVRAKEKKAAIGPDVDLEAYDDAPAPHAYMADEDLCELPQEEQQRLIMAGLDVKQAERGGTFFQKDTSVIHCHSQQEGIEVLPIKNVLASLVTEAIFLGLPSRRPWKKRNGLATITGSSHRWMRTSSRPRRNSGCMTGM